MCKELILKKVRALLAKTIARGATPKEAESAISLATKLMRKHQIEQKDVELAEDDFGHTQLHVYLHKIEGSIWEWKLLSIIAKANLCKVFGQKINDNEASGGIMLYIVGKEENRKAVECMFKTTVDFIRPLYSPSYRIWKQEKIKVLSRKLTPDFIEDSWKEFERTKVVPSRYLWIKSYLFGVCDGVDARLYRQDKEEAPKNRHDYGLIKVKHNDLINGYANLTFGEIDRHSPMKATLNNAAYYKGKEHGVIDPTANQIA